MSRCVSVPVCFELPRWIPKRSSEDEGDAMMKYRGPQIHSFQETSEFTKEPPKNPLHKSCDQVVISHFPSSPSSSSLISLRSPVLAVYEFSENEREFSVHSSNDNNLGAW